ncbi:hypothetical protein [Virgibacillus kimchii]
MNKIKYFLPLFLIILIGCSAEVTEEDLIGGYWIGTAGYTEGEPKGDPYCTPFDEGLEFKDNDTVHVEVNEENMDYWLDERENRDVIYFSGELDYRSYYIEKLNENEIGLKGTGSREKESCYLERQ